MSTTIGTLELIHQLAAAEELDENHALRLAAHLNDNDGARHTWPGNMLFDFLVNVYEDGSMRAYELEALARIIEGVLLQAEGMAAEAAENEPAPINLDEVPDETLVLPDLTHLDDLGLNGRPSFPDVFFSNMQCDCLDWQTTRRKLPPNSLGRICRHLAKHLFDNLKLLPAERVNLRRLIEWAGGAQRGLPPQPEWQLLTIEDDTLIVGRGTGKTCWVFAPDKDRLEVFSYDLVDQEWSLYNRPPQHRNEDLKGFLTDLANAFQGALAAA